MADARTRVCVAFSPEPRDVREWNFELPVGSTVADAIAASGLRTEFPRLELEGLTVAVWSRKAAMDHVLRDRDRVEICRPLKVDPKVARRERFRKQGARAAGLFARKR
jgi:putative ubiquitin-RnfH superfamily antitoxin RatB of RatAB toxin-antitoxin module